MKLTLALVIMLVTTCIANANDSLVGKWVSQNFRTVIGTGATDAEMIISGKPTNYRVRYTSGSTQRLEERNAEGRFIFKTTVTTYSDISLEEKDGLYVIAFPESNRTIYLRFRRSEESESLVIVDKDEKETSDVGLPFYKVKDKRHHLSAP